MTGLVARSRPAASVPPPRPRAPASRPSDDATALAAAADLGPAPSRRSARRARVASAAASAGVAHDGAARRRDADRPEQLLALGVRTVVSGPSGRSSQFGRPGSRRQPLADVRRCSAPGVKFFSMPAASSLGMSSAGMMPPPKTSDVAGAHARVAADDLAGTASCARRSESSGRSRQRPRRPPSPRSARALVQAGVDHLHPRVAQRPRHDLRAPVVPVAAPPSRRRRGARSSAIGREV